MYLCLHSSRSHFTPAEHNRFSPARGMTSDLSGQFSSWSKVNIDNKNHCDRNRLCVYRYIVHFHCACLRTQIFYKELTLRSTLSLKTQSFCFVDPQFSLIRSVIRQHSSVFHQHSSVIRHGRHVVAKNMAAVRSITCAVMNTLRFFLSTCLSL